VLVSAHVHDPPGLPDAAHRIHPNDPLYGEVVSWLHDEAALLDEHRYDEWLVLLAEDLVYRVPIRVTRFEAEGDRDDTEAGLSHFDETRASLAARILRVREPTAWSEHPPSRTRHLVTNVRVWNRDGGYEVRSALLLLRSRGASSEQYDRSHPSHPPELVDDLVDHAGLRVLDPDRRAGELRRHLRTRPSPSLILVRRAATPIRATAP
jgi:3-phenylpropionate/cinnamic acid dioxygenase small subunit